MTGPFLGVIFAGNDILIRTDYYEYYLNDFQRIEITHKCEDAVKAKAKERQYKGGNQYTERVGEKFPEGSKEFMKSRNHEYMKA